jgi:hypothetical protein
MMLTSPSVETLMRVVPGSTRSSSVSKRLRS